MLPWLFSLSSCCPGFLPKGSVFFIRSLGFLKMGLYRTIVGRKWSVVFLLFLVISRGQIVMAWEGERERERVVGTESGVTLLERV